MNVFRFSFLGVVCIACGPGGGGNDAGSDATSDVAVGSDASSKDASSSDAPSDVATGDGGSCTTQVQAVINGGCTRCWPAALQMCTQGNPDAVLGMLACLTGGHCWDEFDPNTAGPCMQAVTSTYGDSNTTAVQTKLEGLGCSATIVTGSTATATEMSTADRASFATCINAMTTCGTAALQGCLDGTSYDASLCQN